MIRQDLTGQTFHKLAVKNYCYTLKCRAYWNCVCDCGKTCIVAAKQLKSGKTKSCGCFHIERIKQTSIKHSYRQHPLYVIWCGMKQRCYNPNSKRYALYGGRGIKVCKDWFDCKVFIEWCLANGWQKGLEIDRENNSGDYEPSNCRIVTHLTNGNNTRMCKYITFNGKTLTISGWERELNTKKGNVKSRLLNGWSIEDALTKPFLKGGHPRP